MSATTARGQDSELSLFFDTRSYSSLAILSAELTWNIEIKESMILGDKFTRVDEVFKNVTGTIEWQIDSRESFEMIQIIIERAQLRRPPRAISSLKTSIRLPSDGTRALIVAPDIKFGNLPLRIPSQDEAIMLSLSWACETAGVILH